MAVVGSRLLGGVLKGDTEAGAPIAAIPVMAAFVDLPLAVMVMLVPNLLTNIRQAVQFRHAHPEVVFLWPYINGGGLGVLIGTWLLTGLPGRWFDILITCVVRAYVFFRFAPPDWHIMRAAAPPTSSKAPPAFRRRTTLTFLNAVRLTRPEFIAIVAVVFCVYSALHATILAAMGHFTPEIALPTPALGPVLVEIKAASR